MSPIEGSFRLSAIFRQLRPIRRSRRAFLSTSTPRHIPALSPPVPSTPECPPSGCSCADTPSGLAVDHERLLSGTVPPYAQHVVIRTGRNDWSSKIEDEPDMVGGDIGGVNFARGLKGLVGRGGKFHDPSHPILITNSNEPPPYTEDAPENRKFHAVQVYPQNIRVSKIPQTQEGHEQFAETFLASPEQRVRLLSARKASSMDQEMSSETEFRSEEQKEKHLREDVLRYASILICGHNSRDTRCGILGPLLESEFKKLVLNPASQIHELKPRPDEIGNQHIQQSRPHASVALISHIGGHAFAGNVVIYFPKKWRPRGSSQPSTLAGKGVWYGRVEPRHVWGIVEETLKGGRIIEELLRGIHAPEDEGDVVE